MSRSSRCSSRLSLLRYAGRNPGQGKQAGELEALRSCVPRGIPFGWGNWAMSSDCLMGDVTHLLAAAEQGDPRAAELLLPLVYEELRKLAATKLGNEQPGQTIQATELVHEAYLRLLGVEGGQAWSSRGHFFGAAAQAMRRILIDRARNKQRLKRGGHRGRIDLNRIEVALDTPADELLALDEALDQLAREYPECYELVKLRFFAGLSLGDSASALGIPRRSADRKWAFARAWLHRRLRDTV